MLACIVRRTWHDALAQYTACIAMCLRMHAGV